MSSLNLSVFALDLIYSLEKIDWLSKIKGKKTGETHCALLITCTMTDTSIFQAEVAQALEHVWNENRLSDGEERNSFEIAMGTGDIQLKFFTATTEMYVSGRIEVAGFNPGTSPPDLASR